jgi:imidazolonepropionase-like amidohydrolase
VGGVPRRLDEYEGHASTNGLVVVDASGKWVTPGLVDLHSHIGVAHEW